MAIFSLRHAPVGKTTQARPYTSAAHIRYITRRKALGHLEARRMPDQAGNAARFLIDAEDAARKNARVIDKVMLALPRELTPGQRLDLVRGFADDVTQGRAPWLAAFHDRGKDQHNPHCHLVIHDRDPDTGKRVIGMSESGSTDRLRSLWEDHTNRALLSAGHSARIDRRTLEAQWIDRKPTIHEGPRARGMAGRGVAPNSRIRTQRNGKGARSRTRHVNYPAIDHGVSRVDYNRGILLPETAADYWAAVDADRQKRELDALRLIHLPPVSVDSGVLFRSLGVHVKNGSRAGAHVQPVQLSLPVPPSMDGLIMGEPRLQIAAQGIGWRTREDELTEPLSQRSEKGTKRDGHAESVTSGNGGGKPMGMDDDIDPRHTRELVDARFLYDQAHGRYWGLMKRSYLDPDAAQKRMESYRARHGNQKLYGALSGSVEKTTFGRRPGSLASLGYLGKEAHQKRDDLKIARRELPTAVADFHKAQERLRAATAAIDSAMERRAPATPSHSVGKPEKEPLFVTRTGPGGDQSYRPIEQPEPARSQSKTPTSDKGKFFVTRTGPEGDQSYRPVEARQGEEPMRDFDAAGNRRHQAGQGVAAQPSARPPSFSQKLASRDSKAPEPSPRIFNDGHSHTLPDNWSQLSPEQRQAEQHRMMERPLPDAPASKPESFSQKLAGSKPTPAAEPVKAPASFSRKLAEPRPSSLEKKAPASRKERDIEPDR